jgi:hypothetical protein
LSENLNINRLPLNVLDNIDPDENLLNEIFKTIDSPDQSEYFSIDRYNSTFNLGTEDNLNIFHCNVCSINANGEYFFSVMNSLYKKPDIFCITETWLNETTVDTTSFLNFNSFHTPRPGTGRGGGVSIFINEQLTAIEVKELCIANETIESCVVKVNYDSEEIYIFAVYRPFSDVVDNFTAKLVEMLNSNHIANKNVILLGDMNINLLVQGSVPINGFVNEMHALNFHPTITKPTRFAVGDSNASPSLLDHIWLNFLTKTTSGILSTDISDHCPTFINIPRLKNDSPDKFKITFHDHSHHNFELFLHELYGLEWGLVLAGDANEQAVCFNNIINKLYNKCFPIKTKYVSIKRLEKPWLTSSIIKSIKTKSYYFKLVRLGVISQEFNKLYKNKLTTIVRLARQNYYKEIFENSKNNLKKTWSTIQSLLCRKSRANSIKSILIDGVAVSDEQNVADEFNKFFTSVGIDLDNNIPKSNESPLKYITANLQSSFFVSPVTPSEIENIIGNLKKSSSNKDVLPMKILSKARNILSVPISNLINSSFCSGIFPDFLKVASVIPIFKCGAREDVSNYRPIAILPPLSKIYEKCMTNRLMDYFVKFALLSPSQFGFQKRKSTSDAVLNFVEYIYSCLNSKSHALSIFIDLRKAYDTVNHNILLRKLYKYGIRGLPLKWFESYLRNRKQYVRVGSSCSSILNTSIGLPQGSVVSPLLFLVYINDLPNVSKIFKYILFADDTTLTVNNKIYTDLITLTNIELSKITLWTVTNRLSLNVGKTFAMLFTNRVFDVSDSPVLFNGSEVDVCNRGKFLGVVIDDRLRYSNHIEMLGKKISKSIGIIYKLKNTVPTSILINLYYTLVYPYLLYCNVIWGNTFICHLQPLIILQKKIIRIITGSNYLDPTTPLFYKTKILKLNDINNYMLALYTFKRRAENNVSYPDHNYATRQRNDILPMFQRLSVTQHSPTFSAPHVFNSLPDEVKNSESLYRFKKAVKNYFIGRYY